MLKFFLSSAMLSAAVITQAITLEIVESEMRSYKVGEKVTFTLTAKDDSGEKLSAGKFRLYFRDSGGKNYQKPLAVDLSKTNPLTVTTQLDHPGFIFLTPSKLTTPDGKQLQWKRKTPEPFGGAAVEPEKIRTGGEKPADFDQFWSDGLKSYENVPVEVTPAPEIKRKGYKCYHVKVSFPDGSGQVYGFLAIPQKPGKYPAVVSVPGAGPGTPGLYVAFAPQKIKTIILTMNVHPFKAARNMPEQRKLYNDYVKQFDDGGYAHSNVEDRNKYFFRNVWLAISRAIDHTATLPEFDGKNFAATGGSQGGATALAMAYLNKNITCVAANIPAMCDHHAWKAGRLESWPKIRTKLKGKGKSDDTIAYFDAAFFASSIKVPVFIGLGYVDVTTPPATVYAAYNNLPGPKEIMPLYGIGHAGTAELFKKANAFLSREMNK